MIAEVDCTVEKKICQEHGVKGYPTIKYSTGLSWEKYTGGRDYNSLETFVNEELTDGCLDDESLCSEEELEQLEKVRGMTPKEIKNRLADIGYEKEGADRMYQASVEKLQKDYQTLSMVKDEGMKILKTEEAFLKHVSSEKTEL